MTHLLTKTLTEIDGEEYFLWWMWHGPVGHWVINKTPGHHGGDIIKVRLKVKLNNLIDCQNILHST